jgi:hypothetical protein
LQVHDWPQPQLLPQLHAPLEVQPQSEPGIVIDRVGNRV